jgi:MYXO-CTERM domain-containing protein
MPSDSDASSHWLLAGALAAAALAWRRRRVA